MGPAVVEASLWLLWLQHCCVSTVNWCCRCHEGCGKGQKGAAAVEGKRQGAAAAAALCTEHPSRAAHAGTNGLSSCRQCF
jgi:hypothetical protein